MPQFLPRRMADSRQVVSAMAVIPEGPLQAASCLSVYRFKSPDWHGPGQTPSTERCQWQLLTCGGPGTELLVWHSDWRFQA